MEVDKTTEASLVAMIAAENARRAKTGEERIVGSVSAEINLNGESEVVNLVV